MEADESHSKSFLSSLVQLRLGFSFRLFFPRLFSCCSPLAMQSLLVLSPVSLSHSYSTPISLPLHQAKQRVPHVHRHSHCVCVLHWFDDSLHSRHELHAKSRKERVQRLFVHALRACIPFAFFRTSFLSCLLSPHDASPIDHSVAVHPHQRH